MQTLLRIDASVRNQASYSRNLGDYFENLWLKKNPGSKIVRCDLSTVNIPHINHSTTEAFFKGDSNSGILALSNHLVKELKACDVLLITSPLYNLGLPSSLKAYFDHVVRIHETFTLSNNGTYSGLLHNKQAVVITSKGGIFKGTDQAHLDFQEPYLRAILNFMGIEKVAIFSLEGTSIGDRPETMIPEVHAEINNFMKN